MNNFEWSDFDNMDTRIRKYAIDYDKNVRQKRIELCDHSYNFSLINIKAIKSHIKR